MDLGNQVENTIINMKSTNDLLERRPPTEDIFYFSKSL